MNKAGCVTVVVIVILWTLIALDIHVWRHLTGAAVMMDVSVGVLLTFGILYLLPSPNGRR